MSSEIRIKPVLKSVVICLMFLGRSPGLKRRVRGGSLGGLNDNNTLGHSDGSTVGVA